MPHVVPDIITPNLGKTQDWLLSQGSHSAAAGADVAVLNPWNLYLTFGDVTSESAHASPLCPDQNKFLQNLS
mgnify:CR=1 FL=1